jgi:hypothetical protein
VGAALRLAVDPAGFHFFDPESSARLATASTPVPAEALAG